MAIYHICSEDEWAKALAAGEYRTASLDSEGFIHCSHLAQVLGSAERHHAGRTNLLLLSIAPECVTAEVWNEPSRNAELFPHIYGPLNTAAVTATSPLIRGADGRFLLPESEVSAT